VKVFFPLHKPSLALSIQKIIKVILQNKDSTIPKTIIKSKKLKENPEKSLPEANVKQINDKHATSYRSIKDFQKEFFILYI
jgi:hypothetical protein